MEEIIDTTTQDGFGVTIAKTLVLYTVASFGLCMGMLGAGWVTTHVKTNLDGVDVKIKTKTKPEEAE